jgi:hypothetical protein
VTARPTTLLAALSGGPEASNVLKTAIGLATPSRVTGLSLTDYEIAHYDGEEGRRYD